MDLLDDVVFAGIDGVGGAELAGPLEFGVIGVDGDDRARSDQFCTGDGGVSHSAAADDGDGIVATDRTGIDRRTDAGHHPAAQQSCDGRVGLVIDLGALALVYKRFVGERSDAQSRGQFGAVGQRHLLRGVERVEAVPRAAALTGSALSAHRAPVEDHEITRGDLGHARTDRFHDPCCFVSEEEGIGVVDSALAVGQIGVADAARMDRDDHLARTGVGNDDVDKFDRLAFAPSNHTAHRLTHGSKR